jgi:hypothetical protein
MGSNRFWHIVSVVKERLYASLSCRVANNNLIRVTDPLYLSTLLHLLTSIFHTSPQPLPHLPPIPPLTTPTNDTFPHFPKFFPRNSPAQNSLHLTFSEIPLRAKFNQISTRIAHARIPSFRAKRDLCPMARPRRDEIPLRSRHLALPGSRKNHPTVMRIAATSQPTSKRSVRARL